MARQKVQRITRPSGVEVSPNGKYFYWKCIVSGLETFADEKRFKEVVEKYGNEKKLVKEYVLRPVQKYLDAGWTAERIKSLIKASGGKKLPHLGADEAKRKKEMREAKRKIRGPRKKKLKSFAVGEVAALVANETGSVEEVKVKVYPWTGKPDYFKSEPATLDIAEETERSCLYPNRRLDDLCAGCPVFEVCRNVLKIPAEERNSPKHRRETVKVTHINPFDVE